MTKIMLVEDDNNLREIYQARLEAEGYDIVTAPDGEAALAIASTELPDLVISDVMMPKISGFEMLDILRNTEALKNVKIIMLTALGQAEDSARANSLGANRYLVKSQVTLEDIVKAAHELLDSTPDAPAALASVPSPDAVEAGYGPYNDPRDNQTYFTPVSEPDTVPSQNQDVSAAPVASAPPVPEPFAPAFAAPNISVAPEPAAEPVAAPATPSFAVVEAPAEPAADAPASLAQPSVPVSEAEVSQAAPLPAAQEEASINDQIQNFIRNQPAPAPATFEPLPSEPQPTPVAATPVEPAAPPTPAVPAAPWSTMPITATTPVVNDIADFEPAPEELATNLPPTIISGGVNPATTTTPAPQILQTDATVSSDDAASGANPSTATEPTQPAPSLSIPVTQFTDNPALADDDMPVKKVITPLHDLNTRPDLNRLLELEESRSAAQAAARATGTTPPPAQAPAAAMPQPAPQQPFSAPAIDPNSISL
ncbi:MAG TPA: response regulator [Candidatus Saccharimonadales bacterium]|nr:response regulator [Candidatus Saccharimonadales bacterium]